MRFYLQAALALALLLLVTLMMEATSAVVALRLGIMFGLTLAGIKMILKHYNINWPPRSPRR